MYQNPPDKVLGSDHNFYFLFGRLFKVPNLSGELQVHRFRNCRVIFDAVPIITSPT
jgi:hypothetical protein